MVVIRGRLEWFGHLKKKIRTVTHNEQLPTRIWGGGGGEHMYVRKSHVEFEGYCQRDMIYRLEYERGMGQQCKCLSHIYRLYELCLIQSRSAASHPCKQSRSGVVL